MRHAALALLFCLGLGLSPVSAQSADPIEGVISNQLEAFGADDFEDAFSHASPMIRGLFQTPDNFGAMVRNGYPMVHRPADVSYGQREEQADAVLQNVVITDEAGAVHVLRYEMVETEDGWKINGVSLLQAPQVGA
ncbi:DUF4864 domain-containing protein [Roseicyclus sp. F158]|uniref:DUF4864 domain-containing protein n=1 Tax=Tropicimonas omnivorans TaxID=3075590 RepID=A0ABU3DE90_9RHOB|nr:DUF4864 domain-containing protein [Roseicyclus sp. F158]MDT0682043.1 DUF4864 domain-containing protein [Roseicyclus sp. F158]